MKKIRAVEKAAVFGAVAIAAAFAVSASGAGESSETCETALPCGEVRYESACYVLREYNGKIALFKEDVSEPLAVYSMPITRLRPADAELLREGIRLKTKIEVKKLLEDLELTS